MQQTSRWKPPIFVALLASITISSQAGVYAGAPAPQSIFLHTERVELQNELVVVERGTLFVPVNRQKEESDVLAIDLCRFRAEPSAAAAPPLFKLYGGPGFPGLGKLDLAFFKREVWPVTRQIGLDLVIVGQRGIGTSKPNMLLGPIAGFASDQPFERDEFRNSIQEACRAGKEFWLAQGIDLTGFNVIEAAADVNDARLALGYDKIALSGTSFGSHWAMAVMRYHSDIVARAVLSGIEGPDHTWDVPSQVLHTLERIAIAAESDGKLRPAIPEGGLIKALDEVILRLDESPIRTTVTDPKTKKAHEVWLDGHAIRQQVLSKMSSGYGIRDWPRRVLQLYGGNYREAALAHLSNSKPLHGATASFFLLDCSSGVSPRRRKQIESDPARVFLGHLNDAYRFAEPVWNVDLGDEFRSSFQTEIPTVLVHGTWDINTPLENALELVGSFPKGRLVLVDQGSHAALREATGTSPGFREALHAFLQSGDLSAIPERVQLPPVEWTVPED